MTETTGLRILDPVEPPTPEVNIKAPRLDTLDGKVVGLYANDKLRSVELLDMVEEELRQQFKLAGVVRGSYNVGRVMREDEWGEVIRCHAAILTHGD